MKFVTAEQMEEIELMENVEKVECNGNSGRDVNATWYTVYYTDGTEEDIYMK